MVGAIRHVARRVIGRDSHAHFEHEARIHSYATDRGERPRASNSRDEARRKVNLADMPVGSICDVERRTVWEDGHAMWPVEASIDANTIGMGCRP